MLLEVSALIITILLLLMLLHMSSLKLYIYFDTFMLLARKENVEKTNYLANSSFFRFFYSNKQKMWGNLSIEQLLTLTMILLSIVAYIGFVCTGHKNYGILNYYYGDSVEYYFVNIFINIIIILAIIYTLTYIKWAIYDKEDDDKLEENEKILNTFIIDNLSYEYLTYYYEATVLREPKLSIYTIDNFVIDALKTGDIKVDYFKGSNLNNIFKLCFTKEILQDDKYNGKYIKIKKGILDRIFAIGISKDKSNTENIELIRKAFQQTNIFNDFYIVANYNHNNNTALVPLNIMIINMNKDILNTSNDPTITAIKTELSTAGNANTNIQSISDLYEKCLTNFRDTIKTYKAIHDKYSTYYMGSVLLTNFVILYAVLIFIYILIKIMNIISGENPLYSIYNFRSDLINYATFILIIYLFITCPIIIFGFN
jgi:hypothetical protein